MVIHAQSVVVAGLRSGGCRTFRRMVFAGWLIAAVSAPILAEAADWPCFRGPERSGVSSDTRLPLEWSDSRNIVWRAELPGAGASSPVTFGDRVYADDHFANYINLHGYASSTPAVDATGVYTFFDARAVGTSARPRSAPPQPAGSRCVLRGPLPNHLRKGASP